MMNRQAFDNVKSQIGVCGIWCGSCAVGNGALCEVTRRYVEVLEGHGIEHWAPSELDYDAFSNGLSIVAKIASCQGCRRGGGRAECEMKACASERNLRECNVCGELECLHAEVLERMRKGACEAGLFVNTEPGTADARLEDWTAQLRDRFPGCVLFLEEENVA